MPLKQRECEKDGMPTVIFLLGLCGSGKSYLARQLQAETGAEVFEDLLHDNAALLPTLIQALKDGKDCIVHEIQFCMSWPRAWIMQTLSERIEDLKFTWICFENDIDSTNWNVMHRNDGRDVKALQDYNQRLQPFYTYPDGAERRPITRIVPRDTNEIT